MASVICQNFAQNAWRKDLCSNCFKSKDEHGLSAEVEPVKTEQSANVKILGKSYSASVGTIQPPWKAGLNFPRKDSVGSSDSNDLRFHPFSKQRSFFLQNLRRAWEGKERLP